MTANYYVVRASMIGDLQERVNTFLVGGWKLVGGIAAYNGWYYQALVKEKKMSAKRKKKS